MQCGQLSLTAPAVEVGSEGATSTSVVTRGTASCTITRGAASHADPTGPRAAHPSATPGMAIISVTP